MIIEWIQHDDQLTNKMRESYIFPLMDSIQWNTPWAK